MDEKELHRVIRETVHETLVTMGADVKEPLEMQEDFAFLRGMRVGSNLAKRRIFMLMLGGIVTGIGMVLWQGLASFFPGK